jgi:Uma2 family endonuclease
MEPTTLVAVDEYLHTSYDPDVDYVDGVLEERNVGEFDHSDLQSEIVHWIRSNCLDLGLNAFVELRTRIGPTRFRIPDVVILEGKRPRAGGVLDRAPLVAVEILSPEDRSSRMQKRIDDYLSIGTRFVWVIDPESRRAWVYTASSITEVKDGMLRVDRPPFAVPLNDLFANIDRMSE